MILKKEKTLKKEGYSTGKKKSIGEKICWGFFYSLLPCSQWKNMAGIATILFLHINRTLYIWTVKIGIGFDE